MELHTKPGDQRFTMCWRVENIQTFYDRLKTSRKTWQAAPERRATRTPYHRTAMLFREALNQLHGRYGGCILWCCCPRAVDIVETEPNTLFTVVSVVENLDNATENRRCLRFAFRPLIKIMRNQITQLVGRQKMNHEEFWWINCLSESLFKWK